MSRYTYPQRPRLPLIDDAQNAILLRSDIHTMFDQKRFAIVPKSSILLVHIVTRPQTQMTNLYHNVSLQPLVDVAIQHVLARFAWTIFAQSEEFIEQGLTRTLCTYIGDGRTKIADFSGDDCRQLLRGTKSRSQSSRKRNRSGIVTPAEEEEEYKEGLEEGFEEGFEDDNSRVEYERGRRKRRRFDWSSQSSDVNENVFTTSEETVTDTDPDTIDKNDEPPHDADVEREVKRRCLTRPSDGIDSTTKHSLDPHPE